MKDIYSIITDVINGKATASEKEQCTAWIDAHPENREEFESIKLLYDNISPADYELHQEDFYSGLNKIRLKKKSEDQILRTRRFRVTLLAAGFLTVMALVLVWTTQRSRPIKLEFQNTQIQDIIPILESAYNVTIDVVDPEIYQQKVTGTYYNNTLDEVLHSIAGQTGIVVIQNHQHLLLYESRKSDF